MSTRRVTRANSRGTPSARGPSPPVLDLHNLINSEVDNTPAARKNRGESLPAIAPRESTAYGGAGIAKPASIRKPARAPLGAALQNMLEDEEDDELADLQQQQPARQRRGKTPSISRATPTRSRKTPPPPGLEDIQNYPKATLPPGLDDINEEMDYSASNRDNSPALTAGNQSTVFGTPSALNGEADIRTPRAYGRRMTPGSPISGTSPNPRSPIRSPVRNPARSPARSPTLARRAEAEALFGTGVRPQPEIPEELEDLEEVEAPQREVHRVFRAAAVPPPFIQLAEQNTSRPIDWRKLHIWAKDRFLVFLWDIWVVARVSLLFLWDNIGLVISITVSFLLCTTCIFNFFTGASQIISLPFPDNWLSDFRQGVRQFIPSPPSFSSPPAVPSPPLAQPLDGGAMETIKSLLSRMTTAEHDIANLKRQMSLDAKSITELEKSLPDVIVGTKDKSGKVQIPKDFWKALKSKIREESWDFDQGSGSKTTDISNVDFNKIAPKLWDEWLEKNEAKIRAWRAEDFEQAYNKHIKASFKNEILVSRSDLVKMLDDNYKLSTRDIHHEIAKITTKLEDDIRAAKTDARKASMSKNDIDKLVADHVKKMLPKAQLDALADANLYSNLQSSRNRVNHFSMRTGALIIPHLTAPNYNFAANRASRLGRAFLWAWGHGITPPNPPTEALTPWEEHGDCWCAPGPPPSRESNGMYPQLGVFAGNNFFPDEIIIEHIPPSGSLNPDCTPKEIEVFAYIEDGYSRGPLIQQGYNLIPNYEEIPKELKGYVRIAKFTYDRDGPSIQAFEPQVRLGDFVGRLGPEYSNGEAADILRPFTRNMVVRALTNYGEAYTCFYRVKVHGDVAELKDVEEAGGWDGDEEIKGEYHGLDHSI